MDQSGTTWVRSKEKKMLAGQLALAIAALGPRGDADLSMGSAVRPLLISALRSTVGLFVGWGNLTRGNAQKRLNPVSTAVGQSRRPCENRHARPAKWCVQDRLRQSTYIYDTVVGEFVGNPASFRSLYLLL